MKIGLDDIVGLSRNTTPNLMKQILSWARHKSLLAETAAFQWHFFTLYRRAAMARAQKST